MNGSMIFEAADLLQDLLEALKVDRGRDDAGPPIQPLREDQEQPGGEMPVPQGSTSLVAVGTYTELHPDQVIQQ